VSRNAGAKSGDVRCSLTDILHERQQEDFRWTVVPGSRAVTEPAGVLFGPLRRLSALQRTSDYSSTSIILDGARGGGDRRR